MEILVNVSQAEIRIALVDNARLQEICIERLQNQNLIGNIYLARVSRIVPGMQAAFVELGLARCGYLHVSDVDASAVDIQSVLKTGQVLPVQVYKNATSSKGPRVTAMLSISSRYLVFTPGIATISVSQKIVDPAERARLSAMLEATPAGGYIYRTVAEGISQQEIDADKTFLAMLWQTIIDKQKNAEPKTLLYGDIPPVLRILRDIPKVTIERIRIDDAKTVEETQQFAKRYLPQYADCIKLYDSSRPIFDVYSIEEQIQQALFCKVYLKSGGYLVIEQTEAMTTIDVNTGSFVGKKDVEQTIYQTNLEAAEAIAYQLRLRNLGGIIIVDFIDMQQTEHKQQLQQVFRQHLAKDPIKTEVCELTRLGLVQMTRKRTRDSLEHTLCETCHPCHGRGTVKSRLTMSQEILHAVQHAAYYFSWQGILVVAAKDMIHYLSEDKCLNEFAEKARIAIQLRAESTYTREQFNLLPLENT